ncbi:hypothetical protein [Actinomadura sp. 21ATH]|uniref:hypothetical protein n=1 Tax=Actinomadura sp. 21ATH TaxID=1735444 RepID=UPI0035C1CF4B
MAIWRWRTEALLRLSALQERGGRRSRIGPRAWLALLGASRRGGHAWAGIVRLATEDRYAAHPLRGDARHLVAVVWADERDPAVRAVVREHGLIAEHGRARWTTAALHGVLAGHWSDGAEKEIGRLLADDDEDVRAGAARACAEAEEPVLGFLWGAVPGMHEGRRALVGELLRNPAALAGATLGSAWRAWLDEPSEDLWEFLRALGRPAPPDGDGRLHRMSRLALGTAAPADLCAAALADRTPEQVRALVLAACAERGLLPDGPADRAALLLLTGQDVPDGTPLAGAYSTASPRLRARMREAAAHGPGLAAALMRGTGAAAMSAGERAYLAGRLAAERAWPELWRLALDLPPAEAIAAVRPIDGWRPRDGDLLDRMRRFSPERAAAALAGLDAHGPLHIDVDGEIEEYALSHDGTRMAVSAVATRDHRPVHHLTEFELPSGRALARYETTGIELNRSWCDLVHTGDSVVAVVGNPSGSLVRYTAGERELLHDPGFSGQVGCVRLGPGGLVAAGFRAIHLFPPPYGGTRHEIGAAELGLESLWSFAIGVEPATGLVAARDLDIVLLDPEAGRVVARGRDHDVRVGDFAFASPDRLVTAGAEHSVTSWRRAGRVLVPERTARRSRVTHPLTALPPHGCVALPRGEEFLDARTLERIAPPYDTAHAQHFRATPSGRHVAIAFASWIQVHGPYRNPAGRLLDRPMAAAAPADLEAISALIASETCTGDAAELLLIMRLCLLERFRGR